MALFTGTELSQTLTGTSSADSLNGSGGNDTIYGLAGDDTLDGGDGNDSLYGANDEDILIGGEGNDTLDGGIGVDALIGGTGNDVYYIDDLAEAIFDESGNDTAYVSTSFVKLPSTIENVIYTNGAVALPYWIDALLENSAALYRPATLLGSARTFGYIFPTTLPDYERPEDVSNGYLPFSSGQIARAEEALRYIESLIDVRFVETTNAAAENVLTFGNNLQTDSAGYAYLPAEDFYASDIFMNTDENLIGDTTLTDGTWGAYTLIHEIGHAIGLKHPFFAEDNDSPYLPSSEDDTAWTIMS